MVGRAFHQARILPGALAMGRFYIFRELCDASNRHYVIAQEGYICPGAVQQEHLGDVVSFCKRSG